MKNVLITGHKSYIGTSVEQWLSHYSNQYQVDTVDMEAPTWSQKDFSKYDVVFHVAGIAHSEVGTASEEQKRMYYKVNRDLAVEVAQKAKSEGVGQFIFMSSIIVYGGSGSLKHKKVISKETEPKPDNFYGDSKLQAELEIRKMSDENFCIAILRPPMIYGKLSKGNYPVLSRLARRVSIFPDIKNERSMLYIKNFCEFVRLVIEKKQKGILFPQNEEYVKTAAMVQRIAETQEKEVHLTSAFNWLVYIMAYMPGEVGDLLNKAFGSLIYDKDLSGLGELPISSYQVKNFYESIKEAEL